MIIKLDRYDICALEPIFRRLRSAGFSRFSLCCGDETEVTGDLPLEIREKALSCVRRAVQQYEFDH